MSVPPPPPPPPRALNVGAIGAPPVGSVSLDPRMLQVPQQPSNIGTQWQHLQQQQLLLQQQQQLNSLQAPVLQTPVSAFNTGVSSTAQQPVLDILGIAEMAAQALSGLPSAGTSATPVPLAQASLPSAAGQRTDPRAARTQYQNSYMQTSQQQQQQQHQQEKPPLDPRANQYNQQQKSTHQKPSSSAPRTYLHSHSQEDDVNAISEKDLSPMLQYSLKNLQATGHLDKNVGSNACRWLKKMSEPEALQCLERFSSCDVSQMRSKEGYLCGILKKKLGEKSRDY